VAIIEGLNDRYNPLNSVVPSGNSTVFNSVGVQDYKSFDNGVDGTVKLLEGSPWTHVLAALRSGKDRNAVLNAFRTEYASWGSHPAFYAPSVEQMNYVLNKSIGPDGPSTPTHKPSGKHYTVRRGDSLYLVAQREYGNGNEYMKIAHANGIRPPYIIRVGQVLVIP